MANLTFPSHRKTEYTTVSGVGNYTVSVEFKPNFQDVSFVGAQSRLSETTDTVSFDLVETATGYDLTVYYSCSSNRKIKAVIAKLPVNPEQTINF